VTRGSVSDRQAPEGVVPGTTEAAARLQGLSDEQVYVRAGQHGPHDSEYFVSTDFAGPDEGPVHRTGEGKVQAQDAGEETEKSGREVRKIAVSARHRKRETRVVGRAGDPSGSRKSRASSGQPVASFFGVHHFERRRGLQFDHARTRGKRQKRAIQVQR
jgi:hypothetical protein